MYGHSAVYDEGTRCLYVFGGYRYVPSWGAEAHSGQYSEQYGARVVLSGELHALCRPPAAAGASAGPGAGASLANELWTWHVLESKSVRLPLVPFPSLPGRVFCWRICSHDSTFQTIQTIQILTRYLFFVLGSTAFIRVLIVSSTSRSMSARALVCAGSERAGIPRGARAA